MLNMQRLSIWVSGTLPDPGHLHPAIPHFLLSHLRHV